MQVAPPLLKAAERLFFYPHYLMDSIPPRSYPDVRDSDSGFVISSPAKVNLRLRVLRKRQDGYHALETVFQELDWADEIEFSPEQVFSLEIRGANLPADERNLMTRAARSLAEASGHELSGKLRLSKNLPLQGGVGGGSSNAAITLLGLNRLWGLNWPVSHLEPIATKMGADCPFFLHGGLASGTNRGDIIEPLKGAVLGAFVLLIPNFGVETAWAFSEVRFPLTEVEKNVIFSPLRISEEGEAYPQIKPCNDLENIVFHRYSGLPHWRDRILELGAQVALMSGSGSTLFGIFESSEIAQCAALELSQERDLRVKVCRAVARER
ncbi:MAG: 4-(cytidine 5'-diphospho)-2-C-methyl-D-erythritol kinase [bacterium]|nr:4-(cytidine 5'-diphospho)-2-C-methyl-D-erythritol kinase [bacterium]